MDKGHHPHPRCSGLGKEGDRKRTKASEAPATDQCLPGEGKELGEILEMPLSVAQTPGPLPGACQLSSLTSHSSQAESQAP